jgi:hypothetical protein
MKATSRQVKKRGRPRVHETGTMRVLTQLGPEALAAVQRLAREEKRSLSPMLAILIEEALRARQK